MKKLLSGLKIAVDDGHGGTDPGAVNPENPAEYDIHHSLEKFINTFLADYFTALVEFHGAETIDLRPGDTTVSLQQRTDRANQWGAHLFFSWHTNSSTNTLANGAEVHIFKAGGRTWDLTKLINQQLTASGVKTRGVHISNFHVLREVNMPSVLVESGFISNPLEESLLNDVNYLSIIARAGFEAVCLWHTGKLPERDGVFKSIEVLRNAGIAIDPNYWSQVARPGRFASGEYVGVLLKRIADKLSGGA